MKKELTRPLNRESYTQHLAQLQNDMYAHRGARTDDVDHFFSEAKKADLSSEEHITKFTLQQAEELSGKGETRYPHFYLLTQLLDQIDVPAKNADRIVTNVCRYLADQYAKQKTLSKAEMEVNARIFGFGLVEMLWDEMSPELHSEVEHLVTQSFNVDEPPFVKDATQRLQDRFDAGQ